VVYQGAPVSSITLSHLPNSPVSVWADGQAIGAGITNLSGVLTLPDGRKVPARSVREPSGWTIEEPVPGVDTR